MDGNGCAAELRCHRLRKAGSTSARVGERVDGVDEEDEPRLGGVAIEDVEGDAHAAGFNQPMEDESKMMTKVALFTLDEGSSHRRVAGFGEGAESVPEDDRSVLRGEAGPGLVERALHSCRIQHFT